MSAFDTTSNTGSTTFTNAWGTVYLLPSATQQHAFGFRRTTGWKYFEVYIDNAGNGQDLFAGFATAAAGLVYGAQSEQAQVDDAGNTVGRVNFVANQSISTGDTWMFAIDMNGGGRDHLGNNVVGSITDGAGNNLAPLFMEVGRNGTWLSGLVSFSWPMHGIDNHVLPMVLQDPNSVTAAASLRVETLSFVYAIPTGMTAWGDGPEGGGPRSSTYSIAWDPLTINGNISLSQSNLLATKGLYPTSTSYWFVYSTQLPALGSGAGRRLIEFWYDDRQNVTSKPGFGLVDANTAAGALTASVTDSRIYAFQAFNNSIYRRGVAYTSLTSTTMFREVALGGHGVQQYIVDHDNGYIWACSKPAGSTELNGMWGGNLSAGTLCSPYKSTGVDGATITDSVGLRWYFRAGSDWTISYCEINVGQSSPMAYPLMPGVVSYNGNRICYNQGDTWQTALTPSVTYSHSNLGIKSRNPQILHVASSGSRHSGKQFFQVYHGYTALIGAAMTYTTGLRHADMTTLSAFAHTKNNLVVEFNDTGVNQKVCRYSVTSTATWSGNLTNVFFNSIWEAIAVDFDAGKVWYGVLDTRTRTNVWVNGGNPAAGTNPLFTFTASTTLRAFTYLNISGVHPNKPVIFVAEQNNVVDLPNGFDPWNGQGPETSATATPSGTSSGGPAGYRILWPYGFQT